MITRRSMLGGIMAAFVAPAICKPENLMKIWVPPAKVSIRDLTADIDIADCYPKTVVMLDLGMDYDGDCVNQCVFNEKLAFMRYHTLIRNNRPMFVTRRPSRHVEPPELNDDQRFSYILRTYFSR